MNKQTLTLGPECADATGDAHLAIQSAVDYLSYIGGGTLTLQEGVYELGTTLHLRSNIRLEGIPGRTILRKADEIVSPLAADADLHERRVTVAHPEKFRIGQTVTVRKAAASMDFGDTVATIVGTEGNVLYLDRDMFATVFMAQEGIVTTNCSVISGYDCENVSIRHLTIDGNKANNAVTNGCRNAGIFLFNARRSVIADCTVRDYNGDGISYQGGEDIEVVRCVCRDNGGKGVHPGSGTKRTRILECRFVGNGLDGIFLCWRVQDGLVEGCVSERNAQSGLSIGHKDTNNVIRGNRFADNGYYGIFFRNEPDPMGANDNKIENNVITDNGSETMGYVGIRIRGFTRNAELTGNRIEFVKLPPDRTIGICLEEHVGPVRMENNTFVGCRKETHSHWMIETEANLAE
ncbi:right-handed parallel beta-helix repeat-containing protein [Paenibacillus flagellatus]|uniref:Right handed beta helix domain-containing protein n=1 Tax=Paenibacillus flagellatus TaxID=2211139 RepID=A0A2V5K639_9BACL|nr:right-handed parallel beta-helix repeat-containing protein [Paenibacillus flagellatus]PYI54811.1 hypothetical protein DLM86_09660 [Paenibacillus flagellatus]